jgi:hypothetical protein
MIDKAPDIAWFSARPEYWPPPNGGGGLHGIGCLLFGIGTAGVGWLSRLACSGWFAGLEPRAEDLAVAGGLLHGGWTMPAIGASADKGVLLTAAEAFFTSTSLPSAWYAAVAIPRGAGPEEWSATLGLVGALREKSDPLGRKLTVIATTDAATDFVSAPFVRGLLDRGAFVVRADPDALSASGDHLHHFPLRAAVIPRQGQLICVDLADYLHTWRPGRIAHLHVVPFAWDDAELAMDGLPLPKVEGSAHAINIGFHLDPCAQGKPLAQIDRFSTQCSQLFLRPDGDTVFTNTDRLDGTIDSADLLVIYDGANIGA